MAQVLEGAPSELWEYTGPPTGVPLDSGRLLSVCPACGFTVTDGIPLAFEIKECAPLGVWSYGGLLLLSPDRWESLTSRFSGFSIRRAVASAGHGVRREDVPSHVGVMVPVATVEPARVTSRPCGVHSDQCELPDCPSRAPQRVARLRTVNRPQEAVDMFRVRGTLRTFLLSRRLRDAVAPWLPEGEWRPIPFSDAAPDPPDWNEPVDWTKL